MNNQAFTYAQTQSIAVTGSSGTATFTGGGINSSQLRIANTGAVVAFVRWGLAASVGAAVTTDMPVLPGTVELFNKGAADTVAAITAAGSTTLYCTAGEGS